MNPLGPPVQIAYLVEDVREAASRWTQVHGAGPFFVLDHIAVQNVSHFGEPSAFDHSSAYGQWGSIMVELVCDHGGLFAGHRGVHHLAHFATDLVTARQWCTDHAMPEAMYAETGRGMPFVFHDARATTGHYLELYEPDPGILAFYKMVADASMNWDGADPVRTITR
jgi:Glyoxalase/Bleomycin resistance protein/Dioxygenase superfamily